MPFYAFWGLSYFHLHAFLSRLSYWVNLHKRTKIVFKKTDTGFQRIKHESARLIKKK